MVVPGKERKIHGIGLILNWVKKCLIKNNEDPCLAESIVEEFCDPKSSKEENWSDIKKEMRKRGYVTADYLMKEEESHREKYKENYQRTVKMKYAEIPVDKIDPNPFQPRITFGEIEGLAKTIKDYDLINPITVRKVKTRYQLIAGERRFLAFQKLGREKIPAIIREVDDKDLAIMPLIENTKRKDLSTIEKGQGLYSIILKLGFKGSHRTLYRLLNTVHSTVYRGRELNEMHRKIHEICKEIGITPKTASDWLKAISVDRKILEKELLKDRKKKLNGKIMSLLGTLESRRIQKRLYDIIEGGNITVAENISSDKKENRLIKAVKECLKKMHEDSVIKLLKKPIIDIDQLEELSQRKSRGTFGNKVRIIKMTKVETKMIDVACILDVPKKQIEVKVLDFLEDMISHKNRFYIELIEEGPLRKA